MHKQLIGDNDYFRHFFDGVQYVVRDTEMEEGTIFQQQELMPFVSKLHWGSGTPIFDDFYNMSTYSKKREGGDFMTIVLKVN